MRRRKHGQATRAKRGKRAPGERDLPVYLQIQQRVQEMITGPDLAPGDRVPSERALAERFGANRMTVRKAIERLVAMGLLERNGTSGTRVTRPRVARPVEPQSAHGIARVVRSGGGTPGGKLLHFEQGWATAKLAERLRIAEGAEIVIFRRLLTVDDMPFCIETSHLPAQLVPGLAAEDLVAGQSLYALLEQRFGVRPAHNERMIGVAAATDAEARLLGLKPGTSILLQRLLVSDARGRPIEYLRSVNHPQLVVFKTAGAGLSW